MSESIHHDEIGEKDIAIIGMSGRFPMSEDLQEFWNNLKNGVECVTHFTDEELIAEGIDPLVLQDPNYIKAAPILKDVEKFDAAFFGYTPREAEIMDPQQRYFLELAWHALEDSGYVPDSYNGLIGVYASVAWNTYLLSNLSSNQELFKGGNAFQVFTANDKDFMPTRVNYKFNLKGPGMIIQTACSSSLVGIHMAVLSLLNYECDIALAGGSTIKVPQKSGYYYQEGSLASPDGHCRAFDEKAQGTIFGSGAGIVVLKRLAEAIEDGDHIYAVIKGSAINNDGSLKVSYTAPSVDGQAEVVAAAQAVAGINADTIGYIETHGTGTSLGDPIEVAALTKVFRDTTDKKGFCSIGSVKTNVGHLDSAAGVAGFIKTALALKHGEIPPSLNYEKPNPKIDFENSPFFVNHSLRKWERGEGPRRAGVSSFGVGGTNAHVILEEAPPLIASEDIPGYHLLVLSAKTSEALDKATSNLAEHLRKNPGINLADTAYTLKVGRGVFKYRRIVLCDSIEDAISNLESSNPTRVFTAADSKDQRKKPVTFMFTGQGSQYVNMASGLYRDEPVFRQQVDTCCILLKPHLGLDLRDLMFPAPENMEEAEKKLNQTYITQPALFVMEYAMAKVFMNWGIAPNAMIGHSIGEYVAACIAGVFSLEDALMLVAKRGRLMQELPGGSMMAVSISREEIRPYIGAGISLAAVNSPALCVLSGDYQTMDRLEKELGEKGIGTRKLHTSHAFHSEMMDPILDSFKECFQNIRLKAPEIPYISNVTGTWIKDDEATSPTYWANHLRGTVHFSEGIKELCRDEESILIEMGPGSTLSTLAKQHVDRSSKILVLNAIKHPNDNQPDMVLLLAALGKMWMAGHEIDWNIIYQDEKRRRVSLPAYPFQRQRYWIAPKALSFAQTEKVNKVEKLKDMDNWFYGPIWKTSQGPTSLKYHMKTAHAGPWLILMDEHGLGQQMLTVLKEQGYDVITIANGSRFEEINDKAYSIDCENSGDYHTLFSTLQSKGSLPDTVVHLWSVHEKQGMEQKGDSFHETQKTGFYSILYLAQAMGALESSAPVRLGILSNQILTIGSQEELHVEKSTILGLCKVIPQEYPNISCKYIDMELSQTMDPAFIEKLLGEILFESKEKNVVYRRNKRWVQDFEKIKIENNIPIEEKIRPNGVYVITGELEGVGLALIRYLSKRTKGNILLIGRSRMPHRSEWEHWLNTHDEGDNTCQNIREIQALEKDGPLISVIYAKLSDTEEIHKIITGIKEEFGSIHGIIHAAGVDEKEIFSLIHETDKEKCELHFQYKAHALMALDKAFCGIQPDFALALSSIASILGGLGYAAYASSNLFIDAFTQGNGNTNNLTWTSVNLDAWKLENQHDQAGYSSSMQHSPLNLITDFSSTLAALAMTPEEGLEVFDKILTLENMEQVIVSTSNLWLRIEELREKNKSVSGLEDSNPEDMKERQLHPRPNLQTPYVAPKNQMQEVISGIWAKAFGFEKVGIHDNFFDLGGDSLIAIQVINQLKKQLKRDIPAVSLYQALHIEGMAELLSLDESQENEERAAEFEEQKDKMSKRKQFQQRKRLSKMERDEDDDE